MSRNVSVLPSSSTRPVALFDERGQITAMGLKAVAALQAAGLQVSEISVHKEGDVPRYTWKEEQGVWKRQEVGQQK